MTFSISSADLTSNLDGTLIMMSDVWHMYCQNYLKKEEIIYELRHEKANFLHMRKQRRRSALRLTAKLVGGFVFLYTDSTIPLLPEAVSSSLWPSSVAVRPGLCRTGSETRTLVFS